MKCTFNLRNRNAKNETLILFISYFNEEKKKLVYSTKESILPSHWDFKNKQPNKTGKNVSIDQAQISKTLRKFQDVFERVQAQSNLGDVHFDSNVLKEHLNREFERVKRVSSFFEVYDQFTEEKIKLKEWKNSTIKRYQNIRNLLMEFQEVKSYKLTFSKINKKFYIEFTDFCFEHKNHYTNTFSRNIGLVKTFLFWAVKNGFAFNTAFEDFKKPTRVLTREEALSLEDVKLLNEFHCSSRVLNQRKDVFIFQTLTGMRYGELKLVNKRNVVNDQYIILKEEKDSSKPSREIPLIKIALDILLKYNYNLPLISNQKQNDSIKVILKEAGFDHEVEYTRTKGVEQERFIKYFYERVSTHTARRSFITIMRNKGIADKTIMSISGHKDIKTFNMYHQVNDTARINAVNRVFGDM
ncbi:tyrosine-type recombinase/integrase [Nonlabens sp. Asnod2-A12]|uniref:tyrosine-type recombinase/integrase n=1 Tax=Nonlabens sp. Asnod2-A12 TaxID=3160578 RepID=UPI00386BFD69